MAEDQIPHDEIQTRFAEIARELGGDLSRVPDTAPVVELVAPIFSVRTLADLDQAIAHATTKPGAVPLSEREAQALDDFRRSIIDEHRPGSSPDQMLLINARRDGRLVIGTSPADRIEKQSCRLAIFAAPVGAGFVFDYNSTPPTAEPNTQGKRGALPHHLEPSNPDTIVLDATEDSIAPRDIAARCVNNRGVRFHLTTERRAAIYVHRRLEEMGLQVELVTRSRRPGRPWTIAAWLDPVHPID